MNDLEPKPWTVLVHLLFPASIGCFGEDEDDIFIPFDQEVFDRVVWLVAFICCQVLNQYDEVGECTGACFFTVHVEGTGGFYAPFCSVLCVPVVNLFLFFFSDL